MAQFVQGSFSKKVAEIENCYLKWSEMTWNDLKWHEITWLNPKWLFWPEAQLYDQNTTHSNKPPCIETVLGYICDCSNGYKGDNCELVTNECESDPCFNGVCFDYHLTYKCRCELDFTGNKCEILIEPTDFCESSPCDISISTCENTDNEYQCNCKPDYVPDYNIKKKCVTSDDYRRLCKNVAKMIENG